MFREQNSHFFALKILTSTFYLLNSSPGPELPLRPI